jgi:CubicO group peptidase (beta-lactamase class C family)
LAALSRYQDLQAAISKEDKGKMKLMNYLLLSLLCLSLTRMSLSRGRAQAGGDGTDDKSIDEYITTRMRSDRIPGLAVAIVKGDQTVYLKGYGQADPSGRPVTPQTSFLIGSITKPFTSLAVMQLVEAGKVELDAPVQRYIPWFRVADPKASAQITVRMLINQTSGLTQKPSLVTWTWPNSPDALERHVRLLASAKLGSPPGRTFTYANANFVILGMIVQAVTGQSYEDYIKEQIFAPLDMQNSFVSQDAAIQNGMAMGYRWWFGFPFQVTLPFNRANLPAGFLISSAEDMAHFLVAQMNGGRYRDISVLSPDGIALMQARPTSGSHGLGWESVQVNGHWVLNFDGGNANFQASLFFDPETQVGVFITANVINSLDSISSARSTSLLNGITTRIMAESVFSLATNQPLPNQGLGIRRSSLIFDLFILALTGALVFSFLVIPKKYERIEKRGIPHRSDLVKQSGKTAAIHFTGPLALLFVVLKIPNWILLVLYQPDFVYWLYGVATVVSLKGLLEIALLWRVFRKTDQSQDQKAV